MKKNVKCLLILEYGIPHYREFIYSYIRDKFIEFKIIHSGERFGDSNNYSSKQCVNIVLGREVSICLINIMDVFKSDLIITTFNLRKPHTWLPLLFIRKKPIILWGQGVGRSRNLIINIIRKYIIDKSQGYIVYTNDGKKELINYGVNEFKISVANNTLKIDNSSKTNGSEYLLYVGRIQKRKGLIKVLKVLKKAKRKFLIVGAGDYLNTLKEYVIKNHISELVEFHLPTYDDAKLKDFFSGAIAYISPDHVGLGVVHSFGYGVPVITCRNGEHSPEFAYCNCDNSYLYNKPEELKSIINEVFIDDNKRDKKRNNAYEYYVKNLDYRNMYKAFDYHFKQIYK